MSGRKLKEEVYLALKEKDPEKGLAAIRRYVPRQVVNPLFSFFYNPEPMIRWRAVTAMGEVVSRLADDHMESARVVMRRLMWNLNDESGGIGWGSPEAMGEITARHPQLADEYGRLLESYIREDGNYLEHPDLQAGVLWGLGRLAHARPCIVQTAAAFLDPFLTHGTPIHKGLAAWVSQAIFHPCLRSALEGLEKDETPLTLYLNGVFIETTIGRLAREALDRHTI